MGQTDKELSCFIDGLLAPIRWVTVIALMLLSLAQPLPGRIGWPSWMLLLVFVMYNLLLALAGRLVPKLRSLRYIVIFDLPVVAVIYALGATPGGPLYVLFLLITTCAAASLSLRWSLFYTSVVMILMALIAPTLPRWVPGREDIRELGAQLIVLALVGVGTALLIRRLFLERMAVQTSRAEAERLEELDRVRGEFIASISHELQTPLTAAKAALGMLEVSGLDRLQPEERKLVHNTQRNIHRLGVLLGDLLAYNQIQAGALQLEREPVELMEVIAEAVTTAEPLIREKGQQLEIMPCGRVNYEGDAKRLAQVITNLLMNAYHHTPAGTQIVVCCEETPEQVQLRVSDTGPGIPLGEQAAIFKRFYRLRANSAGSGLGLAIAKGLIELHGGKIWLESVVGQGATFHIVLPRQPSKPHAHA